MKPLSHTTLEILFGSLLCEFLVSEYGSKGVDQIVCFFKFWVECEKYLRTLFLRCAPLLSAHGQLLATSCLCLYKSLAIFKPFGFKASVQPHRFSSALALLPVLPMPFPHSLAVSLSLRCQIFEVFAKLCLLSVHLLYGFSFQAQAYLFAASPPRFTTWKQSRMTVALGNASRAMTRMQSERSIVIFSTISRLSAGSCMRTFSTSAGFVPLTTAMIAPCDHGHPCCER